MDWGALATDFLLNLSSEAIGIAVAVLVIDRLLKQREERRWAPARASLAKHFARTYSTAVNATYLLVRPFSGPSPLSNIPPQKLCNEALSKFSRQLKRFQTVVDLNNAALDASYMSHVSAFLDAADLLELRLKFLVNVHHPQNGEACFVCDPPVALIEKMAGCLQHFQDLHPEPWFDRTVVETPLKTVTELEATYTKAAASTQRLCFSPETHKLGEAPLTCVPDEDHLRRIPTRGVPPGKGIRVVVVTPD